MQIQIKKNVPITKDVFEYEIEKVTYCCQTLQEISEKVLPNGYQYSTISFEGNVKLTHAARCGEGILWERETPITYCPYCGEKITVKDSEENGKIQE